MVEDWSGVVGAVGYDPHATPACIPVVGASESPSEVDAGDTGCSHGVADDGDAVSDGSLPELEVCHDSTSGPDARCVRVYRTQKAKNDRVSHVDTLTLRKDRWVAAQAPSVFVCPDTIVSKPWLGFGGSFTEASAVTIQKLGKKERREVLTACFSREKGLGYTLGRVPIGSCDFGLEHWTCGDLMDGDMELLGFSVDRYHEAILPLIVEATMVAGEPLTLLASPWSPPPWMKTTGEFNGAGRLRPDCRGAWALHYVRFVQELARAGVPIWGVSVQNEPEAAQSWESCLYSAEEERDFVRDYLGPALERAGLGNIKIIVWDHNRDGMLERAAIAYSDPQAAKYIWGVGYHWYGDARFEAWPDVCEVHFEERPEGAGPAVELRGQAGFGNVRRVAELRPDKHVIFTEGCQELHGQPLASALGDWRVGERYAMNIIADMNSGCEGWIDWNICLDETGGPNHVGNFCLAPIICDTVQGRVFFQPAYWYLLHFARFVRPGAARAVCAASRDALEVTAFVNLDASVAVIVMNQSNEQVDFWFKLAGVGAALACAPPRSISTLVIDGELEGQ